MKSGKKVRILIMGKTHKAKVLEVKSNTVYVTWGKDHVGWVWRNEVISC